MARTARASAGNVIYHVTNRGNARATVFHGDHDYAAFLRLLRTGCARRPMRVLAYCLMPNHFHLVLWPIGDRDLSTWMQWLLTAHVRRHHKLRGSSGRIWTGRFKAFPIQNDVHLLTVLRYVERNPVRANLISRAEDWRWSSASHHQSPDWLAPSPVERPSPWLPWVNEPQTSGELEALRLCVNRGRPWGSRAWVHRTAARLGLESSLRPRGRPSKK